MEAIDWRIFIKILMYNGSYLVVPFLAALAWLWWKHYLPTGVVLFSLVVSLLFVWSRFVEPQLIVTQTTTIPFPTTTTIILISDLHVGLFGKDEVFLSRVAKRINMIEADYVLIAGDFTYEPKPGELKRLLAPLSDITNPVYAVLGNHDIERPGPPLRAELEATLVEHKVTLLNNDIVALPEFQLFGLGDAWGPEDNVHIIQPDAGRPQIVLTHNPDTTKKYLHPVDLTLAGHTHAGQVRIPWLYKKVIPTQGDFDTGLSQEPNTTLFISSGLGETGVPLRFLNPPTINVLKLQPET